MQAAAFFAQPRPGLGQLLHRDEKFTEFRVGGQRLPKLRGRLAEQKRVAAQRHTEGLVRADVDGERTLAAS